MHGISKVNIRIFFGEFFNGVTDVEESLSKVFATMTRYYNKLALGRGLGIARMNTNSFYA